MRLPTEVLPFTDLDLIVCAGASSPQVEGGRVAPISILIGQLADRAAKLNPPAGKEVTA